MTKLVTIAHRRDQCTSKLNGCRKKNKPRKMTWTIRAKLVTMVVVWGVSVLSLYVVWVLVLTYVVQVELRLVLRHVVSVTVETMMLRAAD